MKKYTVIVTIFFILFLSSSQSTFGEPSGNDLILTRKIDIFEGRINELSNSLKSTESHFTEIQKLSIESANRSLTIIGILVSLLGLLFAVVSGMVLKMMRSTIKDRVNAEVKKQVETSEKKLEAKVEELGMRQKNLKEQFQSIMQKQEYHDHLFELLSPSEIQQSKGIAGFRTKPIKDDQIVISILKSFEHSKNPLLRLESFHARVACGDQTAEDKIEAAVSIEKEHDNKNNKGKET